jgi:hypothetical protein
MGNDDLARQLHDRVTRDEELSSTEQAYLENWYARQDAEESKLLAGVSPPASRALRHLLDAAGLLEEHRELLKEQRKLLQSLLRRKA